RFVAQSHTPCNRCVRFATTVTSGHATLATKRTLPLTWAGLAPAGSHQLCLAGRGRDASYLAPPAQIRTCSFPAYGSHLGYQRRRYAAVCKPAPLTRVPGTVPGACFAGPHSPWPPPLAPPAPQRIAPLCSSASQLLWQSPTSRARASSATAPRLPDADRRREQLTARREISQVPTQSICA